jgi:hypothetical protein
LGKCWKVLLWKMLVYVFYGHLVYLQSFGIFCGHLGYFIVTWYIFFRFGMLYELKSGNPEV